MSEDLFKNTSSDIPDELWKAPAPMQRQVDAAVMWAELTGKNREEDERQAAEESLKEELAEKKASLEALAPLRWGARNPELLGAAIGAPIGVASSLRQSATGPGGVSRREASILGRLAAIEKEDELKGKDSTGKKKMVALKLRLAEWERKNRALGALANAGAGAAAGAGVGSIQARLLGRGQ